MGMSAKMRIAKKPAGMLLALCAALVMAGCGAGAASGGEVFPAPSGDSSAYPEIDGSIECASVVELIINPAFRLYLDEAQCVIRAESLNDDAASVCSRLELAGEPFDEAFAEILEEAVSQSFLTDGKDVHVEVVRNSAEVYAPDIVQHTAEILDDILERHELEGSCSVTMAEEIIAEQSEGWQEADLEAYADGSDSGSGLNAPEEENDPTCDLCHGECTVVCDLCSGTGSILELETREVEVRNDYVCPYCGGAGILDDGMHGGETAVCGFCGGEGETGPMSGEFREKAFDTETVEEEVSRVCPRCNGAGTMDCPHCNGTGVIE